MLVMLASAWRQRWVWQAEAGGAVITSHSSQRSALMEVEACEVWTPYGSIKVTVQVSEGDCRHGSHPTQPHSWLSHQ